MEDYVGDNRAKVKDYFLYEAVGIAQSAVGTGESGGGARPDDCRLPTVRFGAISCSKVTVRGAFSHILTRLD